MNAVLVAGSRGLVGTHLVAALKMRRARVLTADLHPAEGDLALDLTDDAAVARFLDAHPADLVLCAAAEPSVEGCEKEPARTRAINVQAPTRLAARLAGRGARLVVFSSEYVFDGARDTPYVEDDAPAPINEYGRQKLELERGVGAFPEHLVVRTSGVYGRERLRKNFVYQLLDRAAAGGGLRVPDDQLITPTAATSLAELTLQAVEHGVRGVLHLAGAEIVERVAFARLVCEVFGLEPAMAVLPTPTAQLGLAAPRPRRAGLSVERARKLGLTPLVGPREGLATLKRELSAEAMNRS